MQHELSTRQKQHVLATVTKAKELCRARDCEPADTVLALLTAAAYICHEHIDDPEKSLHALQNALTPAVFAAQRLRP
jgi:hypothetical protein